MKKELVKSFFNSNGKIFANLTKDGILTKTEYEKDRLRIFGNRAHAIDTSLFDEVLSSGGKVLHLKEKSLTGKSRLWSISLKTLERAPHRRIRGLERIIIELEKCTLVSGQPELWYLEKRKKLEERLVAPKSEQMVLFAPRNELFCRLKYEMGANV